MLFQSFRYALGGRDAPFCDMPSIFVVKRASIVGTCTLLLYCDIKTIIIYPSQYVEYGTLKLKIPFEGCTHPSLSRMPEWKSSQLSLYCKIVCPSKRTLTCACLRRFVFVS